MPIKSPKKVGTPTQKYRTAVQVRTVCTEGFDLWLAVLDNELFDVRQDMQAISDARSNTYDGELGYEC